MYNAGIKSQRIRLFTAVAAGGGGLLSLSTARADFILQVTPGVTSGGDTAYVLSALNNGLHGTGSTLKAFDLSVSTPGSGTTGALVIDLTTGDGSGALVDVGGMTDLDEVTPEFGKTTGTFLGIGSGPIASPLSVSSTSEPHSSTTPTSVKVNGQTSPAIFQTGGSESDLNSAFVHNTVHTLDVAAMLSTGKLADTAAIPFANVVVPTGTSFSVTGFLEGETGTKTIVGSGSSSGPASGPFISLTSKIPSTGSNFIGALDVSGGHGQYLGADVSVAGAAQTTGYLEVSGFNPVSDKEIYAVALEDGGKLLSQTSPALGSIIAALNKSLGKTGTASLIPSDMMGLAPPTTYDALLTFPTGPSPSSDPSVLQYSFANYTTNGTLTIAQISVIPEPTGLSVVAAGSLGALVRRRRRPSVV